MSATQYSKSQKEELHKVTCLLDEATKLMAEIKDHNSDSDDSHHIVLETSHSNTSSNSSTALTHIPDTFKNSSIDDDFSCAQRTPDRCSTPSDVPNLNEQIKQKQLEFWNLKCNSQEAKLALLKLQIQNETLRNERLTKTSYYNF